MRRHTGSVVRYFLISNLLLQLPLAPHAHANIVVDEKVSAGIILISILVLGGEAFLVTWLFRRRGFNRVYFGMALFVVNFITWWLFFNVYRLIIKNIFLVEGSIVVLEGIAIYYLSRVPFIRSHSDKPVGILGAACSSALGNLFSWALGMLIFFILLYFRRLQQGT